MSCRHVRDWLHRDSAELDEAQRLILDDHLAGCERCRGDRARLRQVHAIGTLMPSGLEPRDVNRAIARALIEGAPRREPAPARRRWVLALAGVAIAATASAAVAVRVLRSDAPDEVTPPAPPSPSPVRETPPRPAPASEPKQLQVGADAIAASAMAVTAVDTPRTNVQPPRGPTLADLLRLAESAQAQGQLELAIEHYSELASAFRTAPEAESAMYAAARLELRLGHSARAKVRLDDYLTRYPRGRYVDDVRRELSLIR